MTIKIIPAQTSIRGFYCRTIAAALYEGKKLVAITNGQESSETLKVWRNEGKCFWTFSWESEPHFPVSEAVAAIRAASWAYDVNAAKYFLIGKEACISPDTLYFTDTVPGEKQNNGGEYGFWTEYRPIAEALGVYEVYTCTTCDFDDCGTGYQGVKALTLQQYQLMQRESDEVERMGSLY